MRERELKVILADDATLPDLSGAMDGATLGPPELRRTDDVYYDTADLRLLRWGATLRHRSTEGWTVKIPHPTTGPGLDRDEVGFDGPPGTPPEGALALVASFTRAAPVTPVAKLSTERTARTWLDRDGVMVAELVDDRVVGRSLLENQPDGQPDGQSDGQAAVEPVRFRQVEVELGPDADDSLLDAVAALLPPPEDGEPEVKVARVLGPVALAPPDVVVPDVPDDATGAEVIAAAVAASVARLIRHLPDVRLGVDPEGVHQARVATRRLRSDLRTFRPLLDQEWAQSLRDELSGLADELGKIRDADVLDGHLRTLLSRHPDIDGKAAEGLFRVLHQQRDADRAQLQAHLDDTRTISLLDHLVAAAASPRTTLEASGPASDVLVPLVAKTWRKLRKAVEALPDDPPPAELHHIRILAKRVRYASEATAPALGRPASKFGSAAADVQDILGEHHDAVIAQDWLETTARRLRGASAFTAGRLAQQFGVDARAQADDWTSAYQKLDQRRSWLK